jgi:hypothetical protein
MRIRSLAFLSFFALAGCNQSDPETVIPINNPDTLSTDQTLFDLRDELDAEVAKRADSRREFEKEKAELEGRIAEAVKKREDLIRIQADHLESLREEEIIELEKLGAIIKDIESWDPIPLGSFSRMREAIEKLSIENQKLREADSVQN